MLINVFNLAKNTADSIVFRQREYQSIAFRMRNHLVFKLKDDKYAQELVELYDRLEACGPLDVFVELKD